MAVVIIVLCVTGILYTLMPKLIRRKKTQKEGCQGRGKNTEKIVVLAPSSGQMADYTDCYSCRTRNVSAPAADDSAGNEFG